MLPLAANSEPTQENLLNENSMPVIARCRYSSHWLCGLFVKQCRRNPWLAHSRSLQHSLLEVVFEQSKRPDFSSGLLNLIVSFRRFRSASASRCSDIYTR